LFNSLIVQASINAMPLGANTLIASSIPSKGKGE
jgi:hypothetical protein